MESFEKFEESLPKWTALKNLMKAYLVKINFILQFYVISFSYFILYSLLLLA